ncbi:MAG: ABC transporter substrate-binding protein [Gemmatimonadota bacterium]
MANPGHFRCVCVAGAAVLAAACGTGDSVSRADRPLILGYASELQTLNPLVSTDQNANELINYLLFTTLVRFDSDFEAAPGLAESWELTDTAVVFHLREDVSWHDGVPVTAEDVSFTFERAKDSALASPLASAFLENVDSAEVLDSHTIRFTFGVVHAQALEDFFWAPVPKHLLEGISPEEMARADYNRAPVGSGPYRLVRWEVNRMLVFEANPDFSPSLGGPPNFPRVVYRIIPDATTRTAELQSGGIDIDGPLGPASAPEVDADPSTVLHRFPWRQFSYIGWNTKRPLLANPAVRRALTMAIDRETILASVLEGYGAVASGIIPPWSPYAPDLAPLPYAPDSAAAILDREGWIDSDGDGVRDKDGVPLRFELLTNQRSAIYPDMAQIVQAQLADIGVVAVPRMLEWQTVLAMHRSRDFDAVLTNWVLDNFRVDPRILFHSRYAAMPNSANRSGYENETADRLMDEGARTTEAGSAKLIWAEFAQVIQADQPLTFLFWQDELAGAAADLEGVHMDARGELATITQWQRRSE